MGGKSVSRSESQHLPKSQLSQKEAHISTRNCYGGKLDNTVNPVLLPFSTLNLMAYWHLRGGGGPVAGCGCWINTHLTFFWFYFSFFWFYFFGFLVVFIFFDFYRFYFFYFL